MFSIILAGTCATALLFDMTGPNCPPAMQTVECQCSECFTWDEEPAPPAPVVRWYDIERTNPDGSFLVVGGTWRRDWIDEDGFDRTAPASNIWCPAKDSSMPREGQLYVYRVRACNLIGCSAYFESVEYVAAPYAIDFFRPPTANNL